MAYPQKCLWFRQFMLTVFSAGTNSVFRLFTQCKKLLGICFVDFQSITDYP